MVLPTALLTVWEKVMVKAVSGSLFGISYWLLGLAKVRALGISCLPLGVILFSKQTRPLASPTTRQNLRKEQEQKKAVGKHQQQTADGKSNTNDESDSNGKDCDENSPAKDPSGLCLLWAIIQLACVISGVFDLHPNKIVKGTLIFQILLKVQDSVEERPLREQRKERERLESAKFWDSILPKALWRLLGFEQVVTDANAADAASPEPTTPPIKPTKTQPEKVLRNLRKTKNAARGTRHTAAEDLIWGALQIAYIVLDWTGKKALGTAILVYLCTLLEDVVVAAFVAQNPRINWTKTVWVGVCLYFNFRWFLSSS